MISTFLSFEALMLSSFLFCHTFLLCSSILLSIFKAFVDFKVEVIVMAHISLFFIFQTFDFVVVVVMVMAERY